MINLSGIAKKYALAMNRQKHSGFNSAELADDMITQHLSQIEEFLSNYRKYRQQPKCH